MDPSNTEAALRESEGRLRLALAAARMGVWTLDLTTGAQSRDANLNHLLGLEAVETSRPLDEFLAHVHANDRAAVRAAFAASVQERRPLNVEFRVVRPDGGVRWLRNRGDAFGDSDAGARHMAGACADVTERREAEEALRAREERLRLILESATDFAIFALARDRTVTDWSPGAEVTFGYAAAEIVGRSGDVIYTPEDRAAGVPEKEAEEARRVGRAADERWHVRKDGARIWASGMLTPLRGGAGGFVKVLRDATARKRLADALHRARVELEGRVRERTAELEAEIAGRADLARRLATVQEDERRRVARDLHDTVGQTLTGLSLAAAAGRLDQVKELADALGRELHEVAVRLRPTALDDVGLAAAVQVLAEEWARRTGVAVEVQAVGLDAGRLPAEVETVLYRVVQESLTNVAKYAGARQVSVVVGRRDGEAVAVVEDDGVGLDPGLLARTPTPGRRGGLGLLGMRERVGLLGGSVEVESEPGLGATVIARILLPPGGPR